MQGLIQTLQRGVRSAANLRTVLPLWLGTLVLGLIQTWPLWGAGGQVLQRPFLGEFATAGADGLVDLLLQNNALLTQLPIWFGLQLLIVLIQRLIYALCAGGMLSVYLGRSTFGQGVRRFALTFIGLDLLLIVLIALLIVLAVIAGLALNSNLGVILGLCLMIVLGIVGEYARAIAVVREDRNPLRIFAHALSFCVRHVAGVALLALLASLLLALVLVILNNIPSSTSVPWLMVIVQQLVILAIVWVKALRLAWAAHYLEQAFTSKNQPTMLNQQIVTVA